MSGTDSRAETENESGDRVENTEVSKLVKSKPLIFTICLIELRIHVLSILTIKVWFS